MAVHARTPVRIDLAGGTLDIWPLHLLHPGSVTVNLAVDIHAEAEATARRSGFSILSEDRGLEVEGATPAELERREPRLRLAARLVAALAADRPVALRLAALAPAHAGLGGSSALAVAAAAALDRHAGSGRSRDELLEVAMDVETAVIAVPTGRQDYLAALHGGLQVLRWEVGGLVRETLPPKSLAGRLVLCYTGAPRFSGANNWEVTKLRIDGDGGVTRRLDAIRDAARALAEALRRDDSAALAAAMNEEWEQRRLLTPGITTPEIETLGAVARRAGAQAFKVCGAGGGGCVVALAEPSCQAAVREALAAHGGEVLDFRVDEAGLVVRSEEKTDHADRGQPPASRR